MTTQLSDEQEILRLFPMAFAAKCPDGLYRIYADSTQGESEQLGKGLTLALAWKDAWDNFSAVRIALDEPDEPVDEESTWSTVFALVVLGAGGLAILAAIVGCGYLAYSFLRFMAHMAAHNPWGFAECCLPFVLAVGLWRSRGGR